MTLEEVLVQMSQTIRDASTGRLISSAAQGNACRLIRLAYEAGKRDGVDEEARRCEDDARIAEERR